MNSGKIRSGIAGGNFALSFHFHEHPDCVVEAVCNLRSERSGGRLLIHTFQAREAT